MPAPRCTPTAVATLRARLEDTAAALAQANLARLLSCEEQLQAALAALSGEDAARADREALRAELRLAETALARCRRLGATLTDFIEVSQAGMHGDVVTSTFRHSA